MSLYSSSTKIFLAGDIPFGFEELLSESKCADIYRLVAKNSSDFAFTAKQTAANDVETAVETIKAPPSGLAIIVASEDGRPLAEAFAELWAIAGVPRPDIEFFDDTESAARTCLASLAKSLDMELRNACRRNVDLRSQIAVLREEVEQANIQFSEMWESVTAEYNGAHKLLWRMDVTDGFIRISPGDKLLQRLPLTMSAWRMGAISILASAHQPSSITARLFAFEDDTPLAQWKLSVGVGVSWAQFPLTNRLPARYQMIGLEISVSEGAGIEFGVFEATNPDEAFYINDVETEKSLAIKLWGDGSFNIGEKNAETKAATALFENLSGVLLEDAPETWVETAEPLSMIEKPPKWFARLGSRLRIHPSMECVAAARVPINYDTFFNGVVLDFEVTEKDAQPVQMCFAVTDPRHPRPSVERIADHADRNVAAVETVKGLKTTGWITALPASRLANISLTFDAPMKNADLILMTRVLGVTASNCNAHFYNLKYILSVPTNET